MSRLQQIIDSTKKITNGQFTFKMHKPPIEYIANFEDYHRAKVRSDGHESPGLAELRKFHENNPHPPTRALKKPWKYTEGGWDHVFVSLNVTRGRVKLSLFQPFVELYDNYQSKAIQPPVEERVRLMKQARYPETLLLKIIKRDQRMKRDSEQNKKFIEKIFGRTK